MIFLAGDLGDGSENIDIPWVADPDGAGLDWLILVPCLGKLGRSGLGTDPCGDANSSWPKPVVFINIGFGLVVLDSDKFGIRSWDPDSIDPLEDEHEFSVATGDSTRL